MKNKILTAEELSKKYTRLRSAVALKDLSEFAIDFAKLHVEAALKQASENVIFDTKIHSEYQGSLGNEEGLLYKDVEVNSINKNSILDAYSLNLIK